MGAIIVQDGEIVGRGHTSQLGTRRSPCGSQCFANAGEKAVGATVYCTLEPCAHYGRTPPSYEALVDARVARVVVGIMDPYPKVNGKGIEYLKQQGIKVTVGLLEEVIKEDLKKFLERVKIGKQE